MGHYSVAIVRHESDPQAIASAVAELEKRGAIERPRKTADRNRVQSFDLSESMFDDAPATEKLLRALSASHDVEVIFVLAESSAEVFWYLHWKSGALVRALVCGDQEQCCWERSEGQPEEWEADAFDGEEIEGLDNEWHPLGWSDEEERIIAPHVGESSVPPDAFKYAECAIKYWA